MDKKKLGIISGMGTKAGLLFTDKLINKIHAPKDQDFPEFIIHNNSRTPDRTLAIVYGQESPLPELLRSIQMINKCEVDYIVCTCVTSFFYINKLDASLRSNILNPIDLIYDVVEKKHKGIQKVGLLATTGAIKSKLFHEKFENSSYEMITVDEREQEEKFMKSLYMDGGLKSAKTCDEAYELFQEAVVSLKNKGVGLILGGCTEVQIGYNKINETLPYVDVVETLVDEVIVRMNLKRAY